MIVKSYIAEKDSNLFNNNLLLFYGENLGLKEDFKKKISKHFSQDSIIKKNQEDLLNNENDFYVDLFNISLFEKKKIFVVSQCNDKIINLLDKIEGKLKDQKIFLFAELLDKKSKLRSTFEKSKKNSCIACYADNELTLKNIIISKLSGYTGLNTKNLNIIIDHCNYDRSKINNELDKIITYFDKKIIITDKLEKILNIKTNENFDTIKNSVISGDSVKTNKLLSDTILEPEKNTFYLASINRHLNKLGEIVEMSKKMNLEEAINGIKPPIFWKDKPFYLSQTQKWNMKKIKSALKQTYDIEILIKTNSIVDKNVIIKKLLVDLCNIAKT